MNHDPEDLEEDDNGLITTTETISEACPYCGKLDAFVERADFSSAYVFCNECSAKGPVACQESDNEEEPGANDAIRQWNRRPSTPAAHDVVKSDQAERFRLLARHYLKALCEIATQEELDDAHQIACAALGSNPPPKPGAIDNSTLIKALSKLTGNRHSDGTSSLVDQEDRKTIINGCHDLLIASRQAAQGHADQIIGQIEELFPNWQSYRDLVDCITCEMQELRKRAEGRL